MPTRRYGASSARWSLPVSWTLRAALSLMIGGIGPNKPETDKRQQ
jgi:hypothetical protein